jgi:hypothetical protein
MARASGQEAEMNTGMLWFDADKSSEIKAKIQRAAAYYQAKYGRRPNVCFTHPGTLGESGVERVGGLEVVPSVSVLQDHYWLGIRENEARIAGQELAEAA